jgi:Uma2 family endonuclease
MPLAREEIAMNAPTLLLEEEQELDTMGSYNHSLVQGNLAYLVRKYSAYSAFVELSLDVSTLDKGKFSDVRDELKPDVCAYPKRSVMDLDILVMSEMPLLVIEIVSPRQGLLEIVKKFQAYFALGIQSCWLVDPITTVVRVYHPHKAPRTFSTQEVVDEVANIKIPVAEIFE